MRDPDKATVEDIQEPTKQDNPLPGLFADFVLTRKIAVSLRIVSHLTFSPHFAYI